MRFNKIAWIGLGNMGGPMAGHLLNNSLPVYAYNRGHERAAAWSATYQSDTADLTSSCERADLAISCIGGDADVRDVFEHTAPLLAPGFIWVDHSTTSATLARELNNKANNMGGHFIDAPITGGQAGAEQGQLAIMLGGDERACHDVLPVLQHYSKRCERIGESGAGQLCKMVNQICYGGIIAGLAEALYFGEQAGLDLHKVLSVIRQGGAQSWQMDNRAETMISGEYDFGFAIDWVCKDLSLVSQQAATNVTPLPLIDALLPRFQQLAQAGMGRLDGSALIESLRQAPDQPNTESNV